MKENLTLIVIIAAIEKHGPMTTLQLTEFVHREASAISRQCMLAAKAGLLQARKIPNGKKTGRSTVKFYRTEKVFVVPKDLPALEVLRPVYADIQPFRHWQDAALFGEHGRSA
jgi:predicted transcriptional regulator